MAKTFLATILATFMVTAGYVYYTTSTATIAANNPNNSSQQFASEANALSPAAGSPESNVAIGGDFSLTDQDGKKVTNADLKGKKLLIFFGFTHCADTCPLTMAVITEVMNQLESGGVGNIQPIFITVDPKRDKAAVIKDYLKDYYQGFIGLTGSKAEIEKVEKEYKVFAAEAKTDKTDEHSHTSNYDVGHSDLIYYMGEDGKYISHFTRDNAPEDIVDYITSH